MGDTLTVTGPSRESRDLVFQTRWAPRAETPVVLCPGMDSVPRSDGMDVPNLLATGCRGVKYLLSAQPGGDSHLWLVCFFNRPSPRRSAALHSLSLPSPTCRFSSFVQVLKAPRFRAKMNKTWLFMMLGTDSTILRSFSFLKAELVKREKVAHSAR